MSDRRGADRTDPAALLRALRSRLGWILLTAALAAAAASVYSLSQDEKYQATASLLPEPSDTSQAAATNLALADRDVVARRTRRGLTRSGNIAAADAVSSVEIRSHGESPIEVEATADDPRIAAQVATAFAEEFVALSAPDVVGVDRATPPESPSSPKAARNTLLGGLAGLLLGIGIALMREKLDRRCLRDPEDFEEAFGLPVLASLPDSDALGRRLGMVRNLPSFEAEAFLTLGAHLRYEPEREVDSVLITSPSTQDGKSTVAFNLAAAAAASSMDVLLVEAEFRRPTLARSLGLPLGRGLASVLAGEDDPWDASHQVLLLDRSGTGAGLSPTLDVLPAGWWPALDELLISERMSEILDEYRRNYSLVVIDSPPLGLVPGLSKLMRGVGGVIIVGRMGKLRSEEAATLRDQLADVDAPTLGLVANFANKAGSGSRPATYL